MSRSARTGMTGDDLAQWLLLSSIVVSFGIVALLLLLNTAMLTGHSSIESAMDFPKNEIRDLRSLSLDEAAIIGAEAHGAFIAESDRLNRFNASYDRFVNETKALYERQGAEVNIDYTLYHKSNSTSMYALIQMVYYDGNTFYSENKADVMVW